MSNRMDLFSELEETQKRGQATESILKMEFTVRDIPVLVPEFDNEPYDFVVELDGNFTRIQAKTAYQQSAGTVQFETLSTRVRSNGYERDGYEGDIDHFAVYNPVIDESYLVDIDGAATGKMEIRYEEPKNNQRKGINWHEDFLLEKRLNQLVEN